MEWAQRAWGETLGDFLAGVSFDLEGNGEAWMFGQRSWGDSRGFALLQGLWWRLGEQPGKGQNCSNSGDSREQVRQASLGA